MEEHDSSFVNKKLTPKDKCLITYQDFLIVGGLIATLFLFGGGIYTVWDENHNAKTIQNEIDFIQKTIHSDGLCITIDTDLKNIFTNCPVISNVNPYTPVSVTPISTDGCTPDQIQQNNENIRLNFQSGIHIPGLDFSMMLNPNTASQDQLSVSDKSALLNQIDISNKFVIDSTGSLMFGDTGTMNALFPMNDASGFNFVNPETFRNFNMFFVGSFPAGSLSSDRCNLNMGLVGPSIYVLLNTNINQVRFCSCVPKQTNVVQEYCTSYLKLVGGISNAH